MGTPAQDVDSGLKVIAAGRFDADAGAPAWFWQLGFTAAITRNAAGDYSLTLEGGGCDAAECVIFVTANAPMAAQRLTSFGVVHVSDTVKRISTMQETGAGGGAASAAADVDFSVLVVKRTAG
jgi:hypothetical protein